MRLYDQEVFLGHKLSREICLFIDEVKFVRNFETFFPMNTNAEY